MAQAHELPEGWQEGGRWYDRRPTGEELAKWFLEVHRLDHEELKHEHYVGGVTLIPANEKMKIPKMVGGEVKILEEWHTVYTAYPKVDIRLRYFYDLCRVNGWLPVIEPDPSVERVVGLPKGYFRHSINVAENRVARYLGCSVIVRAFQEDLRTGGRGKPVFESLAGTKTVPVVREFNNKITPDDSAVMKAQTGAVGRALGMAGIMVLPGAGVATAEDILELAAGGAPAEPEQAVLPQDDASAANEPTIIEARLKEALDRLTAHPEEYQQLEAWASEKRIDLSAVQDSQRRPLLRQAEKQLSRLPTEEETVERP